MHVDEVLWHGKDGGTAWETSPRCCIMRKVVRKEEVAGGMFDFFWALSKPTAPCSWFVDFSQCCRAEVMTREVK